MAKGVESIRKSGQAGAKSAMTMTILFLALALLMASCTKGEPPKMSPGEPSARKVLAIINDEPLYLEQFNMKFELSQMAHFGKRDRSEEKVKELRKNFLSQLIERTILAQEAKKRNIAAAEEEMDNFVREVELEYGAEELSAFMKTRKINMAQWRAEVAENLAIRKLLEEEVNKKSDVSEEEIVKHYRANVEKFAQPPMVRALHIVVATEREAREAKKKLAKGADFSKLAAEISTGPEAKRGGDLGYFEKGVMPKEFDDVVFSLKEGEISKIVQTPFGYHIFKVVGKKKGGKLGLAEVREKIRLILLQEKQDNNYQRFMGEMKANSRVEVKYELID